MTPHPAYENYWERKKLLDEAPPYFRALRWWPSDDLCDIEQEFMTAIRGASSLLDYGAGDLRVMKKFQAAGFVGEYHTLDIGGEFAHTYSDLDQVKRKYAAVLCLDVVEHLPLVEGLTLMNRLVDLLEPGGVLILQTPNARCVRFPLSVDMTHLHVYNHWDLYAFFKCKGMTVEGYRVVVATTRRPPLFDRLQQTFSNFVITRILGADYTDNIAVIARKPQPK